MWYVIGIDPGARTGLAMVDEDGNLKSCLSIKADRLFDRLAAWCSGCNVAAIVVEKPGPSVFHRPGQNTAVHLKIARNLGTVDRRVKEIEAWAGSRGLRLLASAPLRGLTKKALPYETWAQMFKWRGRIVSNHARDAACLAARAAQLLKLETAGSVHRPETQQPGLNARQILGLYLQQIGARGLKHDDCSCEIKALAPQVKCWRCWQFCTPWK